MIREKLREIADVMNKVNREYGEIMTQIDELKKNIDWLFDELFDLQEKVDEWLLNDNDE